MESDRESRAMQLCAEGWAAEHDGRADEARALYQRAWDERTDDRDACIAAHYLARVQGSSKERLRWNREALEHAIAADDDAQVAELLPSLYLDLGRSFEETGNLEAARWCYAEARGGIGDLEETSEADAVAQEVGDGDAPGAPDAGPDGTPDA